VHLEIEYEEIVDCLGVPAKHYKELIEQTEVDRARIAELEAIVAELRLRPGGEDYMVAAASFADMAKKIDLVSEEATKI
jgi:hypothetical protein